MKLSLPYQKYISYAFTALFAFQTMLYFMHGFGFAIISSYHQLSACMPSGSPLHLSALRDLRRSRSQSYVPDRAEELRKNMVSQQLLNGTFLARYAYLTSKKFDYNSQKLKFKISLFEYF